MTNEMKINKCGCGGEARIIGQYNNTIQCKYCQALVGIEALDCLESRVIEKWNTAHPEHKYFNSEQILAVLDSAHANNMITEYNVYSELHDMISCIKEELEISPAMQAVKWLEEGKDIVDINNIKEIYKVSINRHVLLKTNNNICLQVKDLLQRTWQIYEEPKYKEITAEEALTDFALNGVNEKIVTDINNVSFHIDEICHKINLRSQQHGGFWYNRNDIKNMTWVKYD